MNPITGRDRGPQPNAIFAPGAWGTSGYGPYSFGGHHGIPYVDVLPQSLVFQAPYAPQAPGAPYRPPPVAAFQPNGNGQYLRAPQSHPIIDPNLPAAQLTNSTGGTGCEPGYNYFFPAEHTKVHVFKTERPPWQQPQYAALQFHAVHVPCTATLGELLKGFGCNNPAAKKNKCFEVVQGGNGKWYKGMSYTGDDKDMVKKTMKEVGWDSSRNGQPGGKPVVCLWLTNQ